MRTTRLVPALAIVGLLVGGLASPGAATAPTVSATPNRKLVDGQQITLAATGLAPNSDTVIVECATSTVNPDACDLNTLDFTTTDASGAYSGVPFTAVRTLSDGTDCVTNGGCYIGTQSSDGTTASTLIKFDPKIPPFVVTVRVDHTDTVNSKGVVVVRGTVHCENGDADVFVQLGLRQIVDRSIYTSQGFVGTSCTAGSTTAFRATVRPENGFFGPGPASVFVFAQANNHFVQHKVGVTLVSK